MLIAAGWFVSRWAPRFRRRESAGSDMAASGAAHETRDASAGWIFAIVAMMVASAIAIHLLLAGLLREMKSKPAPGDRWQAMSRPVGGVVPPSDAFPALQISPQFDLDRFKAREKLRLESYGWVDRTSGIVHIPIAAAMDLALARGFPTRTNEPAGGRISGPSRYQLQIQRVKERPVGKEAQP